MKALLIAEAANPEWVSVPLEGWFHSRAIGKLCTCHLVTQVRNKAAILRAGLLEGIDFTAIDSEAVARCTHGLGNLLRGGKGKGWTTIMALDSISYYYFEHLVWKQFGNRIRAGEFDIVHRLTPLSPTTPSLLAKKCHTAGIPFVLGPLNGGVPWPKAFREARHAEKEWLSYCRGFYKLLPGYRSTRKYASAILVGSRDTLQQMPRRFKHKTIYIPENAVELSRFMHIRKKNASIPLKAVFVGRLVPYKGADMFIESASPLIRAGLLSVEIIGDGPQMNKLVEQISRDGIESGVHLRGWIEHSKLSEELCNADLFVFPSIREFGGGAVLEAMALGLVPVVVNYGGPAELVTAETGFLINLGTRVSIIKELRAVLTHLTEHPEDIDLRSLAAIQRVRTMFTWDTKAKQVVEVYRRVIGINPVSVEPCPTMELPS